MYRKSTKRIKQNNKLSELSQKPHETATDPTGPNANGPIARMSTKFMMALSALAAMLFVIEVSAGPPTTRPSANSNQHKGDQDECWFGCQGVARPLVT